jgi:hypothetical protein
MTGGGACGLHEGLPVATLCFGLIAVVSGDEAGCFRGTDGLAAVAVSGALGEEGQDGVFEFGGRCDGFLRAAGFAAELYDVPVLGVLFAEGEGAAAGFAEFFFAWGGTIGSGFAVGHGWKLRLKLLRDNLMTGFIQLIDTFQYKCAIG